MSKPESTGPTFRYTVDGEPQETHDHELTPNEIVRLAGLNPDERCLVEIRGKDQIPYKDAMSSPIKIHSNQKFITVFCGPVPVS